MCWDRATGRAAKVHADVDRVRARDQAQGLDCVLREGRQLSELRHRQVLVFGYLAVRDHHHVPGVIGKESENAEDLLTTSDDERLLVGEVKHAEERALRLLLGALGAL